MFHFPIVLWDLKTRPDTIYYILPWHLVKPGRLEMAQLHVYLSIMLPQKSPSSNNLIKEIGHNFYLFPSSGVQCSTNPKNDSNRKIIFSPLQGYLSCPLPVSLFPNVTPLWLSMVFSIFLSWLWVYMINNLHAYHIFSITCCESVHSITLAWGSFINSTSRWWLMNSLTMHPFCSVIILPLKRNLHTV